MAKLADIHAGIAVTVTRGYSTRPAIVHSVTADGKVQVRFTDITAADAKTIPVTNRGYLFGATVRPSAIKVL